MSRYGAKRHAHATVAFEMASDARTAGRIARILRLVTPLACVWLGLTPVACDNAFDPFARDESVSPFYIFGYLDAESDTQYVRVEAIRRTRDRLLESKLDIHVVSTSVESGETVGWTQRVTVLEDGSPGNLFFAPFRARVGATYHLQATQSDGAASRATTSVPQRPEPLIDSVRVSDGSAEQQVSWTAVERHPLATHVQYLVSRASRSEPVSVEINYNQEGRMVAGRFVTTLDLTSDQRVIAQRIGSSALDPPAFYGIALSIRVPSSEWLEPLADHVENGVGFLGALATFRASWSLPPHVVAQLNMIDRQDGAASDPAD